MNQLLLYDPTATSHVPPWFWRWFLWPGRALGHTQLIPFLSPSCMCYLLAFNSPAGKKNSLKQNRPFPAFSLCIVTQLHSPCGVTDTSLRDRVLRELAKLFPSSFLFHPTFLSAV